MARDTDLKRRLELAGLTVTEVAGWQTRGADTLNARGSVHHHTAGPATGVQPSLGIVINGRSDLPGPLCNVHGPREESLRVNLVAAGKANHAGLGGWAGLSGNSSVLGLEEEHHGYPDEPISELRIDRMARVHAAFAFGRFDPAHVCQHYEWAPTRKVDFVHALIDPTGFRRRVAEHLTRMTAGDPAPTPPQTPTGDDNMITAAKNADGRLEVFRVTSVGTVQHAFQSAPDTELGPWWDFPGFEGIAHGISVVAGQSGRLEIFAYAADYSVHQAWQLAPSGGWSGVVKVGG